MSVTKTYYPILMLFIGLLVTGCDDSNPTSSLPALTKDNVDISIELPDSESLGANVIVYNQTTYNWDQTMLELTIREIESGEEYNRTLDLEAIEKGGNTGMFFSSTQRVEGELCYNYQLLVTPAGENGQVSYENGTCSN